jgi:tmRNA-binding protein
MQRMPEHQVSFYDMIGIVRKGTSVKYVLIRKCAIRQSYLHCRRHSVLISDAFQKLPLASPEVSVEDRDRRFLI